MQIWFFMWTWPKSRQWQKPQQHLPVCRQLLRLAAVDSTYLNHFEVFWSYFPRLPCPWRLNARVILCLSHSKPKSQLMQVRSVEQRDRPAAWDLWQSMAHERRTPCRSSRESLGRRGKRSCVATELLRSHTGNEGGERMRRCWKMLHWWCAS